MAVPDGVGRAITLLCCFGALVCSTKAEAPAAKYTTHPVAIVGLGVGGAAAAHYIRKAYPDLEIHGFEKDVIGGRAQEVVAGDKMLELGASVIYGRNMYMKNLTLEMNLTMSRVSDIKVDAKFTIYDGAKFAFKETGWSWWDKLTMLRRYGPALLVYPQFVKAVFKKFFSIYAMQESGQAFNNPAEIAAAMGLMELTQMSGAETMQRELSNHWWSGGAGMQRFMDELPGTVNRVNYNQRNEDLNGFVNTVSFMPATDSDVWLIKEGNNALPRRLVSAAGVKVIQGQAVSTVRQEGGLFYISTATSPAGSDEEFGPYSSVVLATPLDTTNITFEGIPAPALPPREYQTTVTTFVKGRLRAKYFGYDELPLLELSVTNLADTPFTSIAPYDVRPDGEVVYKMFSTEVPGKKLLLDLFEPYSVLATHSWKAYPKYSPPQEFAPFVLFPGLYYNNAIESLASAMEMSMIAGVNSALLVQQHLDSVGGTLQTVEL